MQKLDWKCEFIQLHQTRPAPNKTRYPPWKLIAANSAALCVDKRQENNSNWNVLKDKYVSNSNDEQKWQAYKSINLVSLANVAGNSPEKLLEVRNLFQFQQIILKI